MIVVCDTLSIYIFAVVYLFQGIFKLVGCPRSSVLPLKSGHGEFDSRCHCEWIGKLQDGELDLLVRAVGCEGCNEKYVIECLPGCCYSLCMDGSLYHEQMFDDDVSRSGYMDGDGFCIAARVRPSSTSYAICPQVLLCSS